MELFMILAALGAIGWASKSGDSDRSKVIQKSASLQGEEQGDIWEARPEKGGWVQIYVNGYPTNHFTSEDNAQAYIEKQKKLEDEIKRVSN